MEIQKVVELPVEGKMRKGINSNALQQLLAFASLIVLVVIFSIASANFLQFDNIIGIFLSTAVTGILALGATMIIVTSGIDLSCGTVTNLVFGYDRCICCQLRFTGLGSCCLRYFNRCRSRVNFWSRNCKIEDPPFIATLAMMMIAKGLALVISKATPIYFTSIPSFNKIAMGSIIPGFAIPNAVFIFLEWLFLQA